MGNSKTKRVLYCKAFDEYLMGYIKFEHGDIDMATNYWIFAPIYKMIADKKHQNDYKIRKGIGVKMHFDAKLEVETGGIKGLALKIMLKLVRFVERLQTRMNNK